MSSPMTHLRICLAAVLLLATAAGAQEIRPVALTANDLIYDPGTHRIYASVPSRAGAGGNSIVSIDPVTGQIGPPIFIGSEPDKLAISDDGQDLYVGLEGAAAVRRFDVAGQMAGPQFSLGADSFLGPYYVGDMAVMPGNPDTVAVARINRGVSAAYAGVAVYDNGVPRGKMTGRQDGVDVIAFSHSPNRLYGYNNETTEFGFRRMTVDASGVTVDDVTDGLITGFGVDIRYDGGLIFSTAGQEIDPEARKLLGTFSGLGPRTLVAPDVKAERVYFLVGDNGAARASTWKLLIFDPRTFLMVGSREILGVMGAAHSLIRWGQERADGGGLAFATDQGQLFLIALSPPAPPAAPPALLSLSLAPDSIAGAGTVTATVTLTSSAPAGGFPVMLSSSRPAVAGLPPTLTVPVGALIASTPVTVSAVSAPTDVVITASADGMTRAATLHVDPPRPPLDFSLTLSPSSICVEGTVTATITLNAPAPPGGYGASLSSSNPGLASVPGFLPLPAGVITASAPVTVHAGHVPPTDVLIFAGIGGVSHLATLHINPPPPPAQLALYPNPVPGGLLALGQVTLPQAAEAGGATIPLSSSSPAAVVPAAVFVPAGASTVTFPILTFPVAAPTSVTITANGPGGPVTAVLQLLPATAPSPAANPPVPTPAVPAAPADLAVAAVTSTQVTLTWKDNSTDATALAVWRKGGGAGYPPQAGGARVGALPPNTTTFTDTGLTPGATYTYRVRAIRGNVASDWSNEVSVTVPGGV